MRPRPMGLFRRSLAGVAVLALLAGCASTVAGTAAPAAGVSVPSAASPTAGSPSGVPASTAASPTSGAPSASASGSSVDPAAFAARLQAGNATITAMIGELSINAGDTKATGAFSEEVSAGKVTGMDMNLHLTVSGQLVDMRLLLTGGKVYIANKQILTSLGATDKKWALASVDSKIDELRQFSSQAASYLDSAGVEQYTVVATASSSIRAVGDEAVAGSPAHRYDLVVDVAKAAAVSAGSQQDSMQQALKAGVAEIPTTLWLDDSGRVVQAVSTVAAGASTVSTQLTVTSYNSQVRISAPDQATVFTG